MSHQITGVLFDVGGVLAALDGGPSLTALLGVDAGHEAMHAMWMASPAVIAHETGKIGPAEFAVGVVADLKLPVTPAWSLEDFRLEPPELLFLDDGQRNVDAAMALGLKAHLVRGPGEARAVLATFGVIASTNAV